LIVGGAALAGIPPFAGFFSKEAVLISVGQANQPVVLGAAYLAALLTSYYTFRVIFLILCPNTGSAATVAEGDEPSHGHGEEGATAMGIPILLLSCGAIGLGFLGTWFADYLRLPMVHGEITDLVPAVAVGLAGVLWAWIDFGRKSAPQTGAIVRLPGLHRLFANRWFIDGFYNRVVVACVDGCARICQVFEEKGIDRTGDQLGKGALDSGVTAARWHSGSVQLYIGTAIAMVAVFVVYLGLR
jgi:NADH-quinone oxidoreductase subunit L